MKSIEGIIFLLVALIFIFTIFECHAFSVEHRLTPYEKWLIMIQNQGQNRLHLNNILHKRGCKGFPCMYTHMGGSAGNASIKKAKLMLLKECVADPSCFSIGKRSLSHDKDSSLRRYLMLGKFKSL